MQIYVVQITVRITGKDNNRDFCAGMIIEHTLNMPESFYKIRKCAPILKKHFIQSASITEDQIRHKCKKNNWDLEMTINDN